MLPVASLSLSIKVSRRLLAIQLAAHLVAAVAVLASGIPGWLMATLLALVGASLARMRGSMPVTGLILRGDGSLATVGADGDPKGVQGQATEATVHPHTLVMSGLVVLVFRQQGRLRALTLLADSLAVEDFRQLRLWLRWRSVAAQAA